MGKSISKSDHMATFLKVLTFSLACIYWQQASHACSVHDHGCIHHALGNTVSTSASVTTGPSTLNIYAIGTTPTTGTPSTVDFDNKVLLPGLTSNLFDRVYYQPTGPYIVNQTSYGAANPPPEWNPGGNDGARQVYPSQYKVTFNANTAQARHTGDLNGGENGLIPGATGCPNMPGASNCEAVVVTGNVPNGVYEQRVRIFNYYGVPNPQVDIQAGAYVTGSGVLISGTHIPTQGGKEIAHFSSLSGNGAITDTYKYEFYDRGFDPHASGVAWFDRNRSHMKTTAVTTGDHRVTSTYRNTLTTRTTIQGNGQFDQHSWTTSKLVGRTVVPILPVIEIVNKTLLTGPGSIMPTQEWSLKVSGAPRFGYIDLVDEDVSSKITMAYGAFEEIAEHARKTSDKSTFGDNFKHYPEKSNGKAGWGGGQYVTTTPVKNLANTAKNSFRVAAPIIDGVEVVEIYTNEGSEKGNNAVISKTSGYGAAYIAGSVAAVPLATPCAAGTIVAPVCVGVVIVVGGVVGIVTEEVTKQKLNE